MNVSKVFKNPHFQLIAGMVFGIIAIIFIHDIVVSNPELSIRWGSVIGVILLLCLVIAAYTYLVTGNYSKAHWDNKFLWSVNIIKILSLITLIVMAIATYLGLMSSGYQLGGLLVPWMEILLVMFAIIPLPISSYWAMSNLQKTFNKRYAWVSLYIYLIPLAMVLSLAYSANWLREFCVWSMIYLGL